MPPVPTTRPRPPFSYPAGDPRLVNILKVRFWVYSVRHVLGIGVFAFLALSFLRTSLLMTAILAAGGLGYGAYAVYSARTLFRDWRRQERILREKQASTNGSAGTS